MKLFGKKSKLPEASEGKKLTIEDLITLERYDDAERELKQHLKVARKDLHAHLRLAEVYVAKKEVLKAIDEYSFVADSHADDGFYGKAIAVLGKAAKLAPGDDTLPARIEKYRGMKRLEDRRAFAIEGLLSNKTTATSSAANRKLEVEMLWNSIAKSHLVQQLDAETLKKLFAVMEMQRLQEGFVIAERGAKDPNPKLYLVVTGEIVATLDLADRALTVRSFSTGDVIGESALLERKPWPAKYYVKETGTVFCLDREGLGQAMQGNGDPVSFLSVLRQQGNDRDVAVNVMKIQAG